MRIAVGADHAGFRLKEEVKTWLAGAGHSVADLGTDSELPCDHSDFAHRAADGVATGKHDLAILVCGSGVGMAIAANRHRGIRAAMCAEPYTARMARAHNDANVLCLGARVVGAGLARAVVDAFVGSTFEGGRHAGRVEKLELPYAVYAALDLGPGGYARGAARDAKRTVRSLIARKHRR